MTTNRQIAGLSADHAAKIRQSLASPQELALVCLRERTDEARTRYDEAVEDQTTDQDSLPADELFDATELTAAGFLWQDESGDEWEHLCD